MLKHLTALVLRRNTSMKFSIPRSPGIYIIKCLKNGKFYIGSSINLRARLNQHRNDLRKDKHANKHLQAAWNKYGEKQFEFKILEYCERDMTLIREQHFIDVLRPYERGIGFNIGIDATAAMLGRKASDETRAKLSEKRRQRKLAPETIAKSAIARTGKKRTPEQIERIREGIKNSNREYPQVTQETKDKISLANKGRTLTEEHKAKLSIAHTGKKMSSEAHQKLMNNLCKFSYIVVSPNGEEFTTINLRQFALEHGLRPARLYDVIKGRYHHYKGWKVTRITA